MLEVGSSPRVWGQALDYISGVACARIIPTRVGTSVFKCACYKISQDHPHACGDKVSKIRYLKPSPRIIPTRVGTRFINTGVPVICKNHPHACGDKIGEVYSVIRIVGSSPRVWGQAEYNQNQTKPTGIIPTRVGTSMPSRKGSDDNQDHPHACGDKSSSNS